ncbi:hypothetical protein A2947_02320 [Candidatus Peribacteria bacterium RIFCSPLOWO2_01_FULL_54_110]|nr:MAG: hypothetical protein A2947_02320 [Candidatus Peribacteria bacterium RIFCSPLOWO2_01_FULL_54_110]
MFNPLKPYNALPHLPPKYDFDTVPILKAVNAANIALADLNARASKLPNPWLLMRPLLVRESVASSGIENINTTVLRVFEADILPERRKGATKQVLSYREAMLRGCEFVEKKGFLSTNHMIALQREIEPSKGGIRRIPGTVIMNGATKEVLYTPPEGERLLRDLLANLEQYLNKHGDNTDQLIKMAVVHYQFEAIHPFLDGNGRVGRIIMILYLLLTKRLQLPVLFLSGYIEEHKSEYYRLLRNVTKTGDFGSFVLYMLKAVELQAAATAENVRKIEELIEKSEKKIKEKLPHAHDIVLCIFSEPLLTINRLQKALKLSARQTASKYLSIIVDAGILEERKLGKHKIFFSKAFLRLLS